MTQPHPEEAPSQAAVDVATALSAASVALAEAMMNGAPRHETAALTQSVHVSLVRVAQTIHGVNAAAWTRSDEPLDRLARSQLGADVRVVLGAFDQARARIHAAAVFLDSFPAVDEPVVRGPAAVGRGSEIEATVQRSVATTVGADSMVARMLSNARRPNPPVPLGIPDRFLLPRLSLGQAISQRTSLDTAMRAAAKEANDIWRARVAGVGGDLTDPVEKGIAIVGGIFAGAASPVELLAVIHARRGPAKHRSGTPTPGDLLYCVGGDEHSVGRDNLRKIAAGNWIVHSHSSVIPLSAEDLLTAWSAGAAGVIAVAGEYEFRATANRSGEAGQSSPARPVPAAIEQAYRASMLDRNAWVREFGPIPYPRPEGWSRDAAGVENDIIAQRLAATARLAAVLGMTLTMHRLTGPVVARTAHQLA